MVRSRPPRCVSASYIKRTNTQNDRLEWPWTDINAFWSHKMSFNGTRNNTATDTLWTLMYTRWPNKTAVLLFYDSASTDHEKAF